MKKMISFIVLILLFLTLTSTVVLGKELELTSEFQVVGENDTLPAGAHIKMDLSTGEKWAKLVVVDNNKDNNNEASTKKADHHHVEIQADGSTAVVIQPEKNEHASDNEKDLDETKHEVHPEEPQYDYDMMHRTLSKLPEEEQARIGGLPEFPTGKTPPTAQDRERFETQLKEIWERRQAELKELQEDVIDMPEVLKDRIARIKTYLEDPYVGLQALQASDAMDIDDKDLTIVTDIVSVLQDLEQQLTDVDMTRDFHTMGGWPLLSFLLSDDVHATNETELFQPLVHKIQAHAAWALGTAVKNTGEFFPYAIEPIVMSDGTITSPLALLLGQLQHPSHDVTASAVVKKRQKIVYALGGLLRGNRLGQVHFLQMDGPSVLSQELKYTLSSGSETPLAKRILALTGDIVSDVVLQDGVEEFKSIVEAFSSPDFCQACLDGLELSMLKETSMRTIQTLTPFCDWDKEVAKSTVQKVKRSWQGEDQNMDHEVRRELLDLVGDVLRRIAEK